MITEVVGALVVVDAVDAEVVEVGLSSGARVVSVVWPAGSVVDDVAELAAVDGTVSGPPLLGPEDPQADSNATRPARAVTAKGVGG